MGNCTNRREGAAAEGPPATAAEVSAVETAQSQIRNDGDDGGDSSPSDYENYDGVPSPPNKKRRELRYDESTDYPYFHVIRHPKFLDWRRGLTPDEISTRSASMVALPVEITPRLYLSSAAGVRDVERLVRLGITHVLNVGGAGARGPTRRYRRAGMAYREVDARDEYGYGMLSRHFWECHEFVGAALGLGAGRRDGVNGGDDDESGAEAKARGNDADGAGARVGGKVVVHCLAGVNRSGVIVASQLLVRERYTLLRAVSHCRGRRGNCFLYTNETFLEELVALARSEGLLEDKSELPEGVPEVPPEDPRGLY